MQPQLPFDRASTVESRPPTVEPRVATPEAQLHFVTHPRARRYVIRVTDGGVVRVTIPRWGSKREAAAFAAGQQAWIQKQLQRVGTAPAVPGRLAVDRAAWQRAKRELPPRLLELAACHGLTVKRVSVRNQQWRWGSCSPDGHICLNWRLVSMPAWVRDYVLVHELMHLKRMDHSPRFWKLVAAACPEYEAARAWLRDEGRQRPNTRP